MLCDFGPPRGVRLIRFLKPWPLHIFIVPMLVKTVSENYLHYLFFSHFL